ncbi:MAG: nitroreductase [Rhodocyclaceae bacterium]|nr:MAG: nitroreductase [Rhodocyclaceae bacterium]
MDAAFSKFDSSGIPAAQCDAFQALASRRSVRAFDSDRPVERRVVEQVLELAARAPSGTNTQPWKLRVVAGATRDRLCGRLMQAHETDEADCEEEYHYYPRQWTEPYLSRRIQLGKALYALAGVAKGDRAAMKHQLGRNYQFFGAPVGLLICIDRQLEVGSWLDLGTFLMGIMVAARGFGLHTCPQQAFARFHRLIRAELDIPQQEYVVCGMALGYEDVSAEVNRLATVREPVDAFATFFWD